MLLGELTYFDYEGVSAAQEQMARNYSLSSDQVAAVPQVQGLHDFMCKVRQFYEARPSVNNK